MPNVGIRALRPFSGAYGRVKRGDEIMVSEAHAKHYQERGIAVPSAYKMDRPVRNKMEGLPANKAAANPSEAPLPGGQTGEGKPSSSLRAGQASKDSRSKA